MPIVKRSAKVSHSSAQMYDLVNDVKHYSAFIPWCVESKIINENVDEIHAKLVFAKSGLRKEFTTCNRLSPHKMIEIRLLEGPFKHMEGFWMFESITDASSLVSLELEFEFAAGWLGAMFGPLFHQVANRLVDVFRERADHVYG